MSNELVHYGVKGMKWGVRKQRTGRLNVRASRLERVAAGKGSFRDKATTVAGTSVYGAVKSRGSLRDEAARRAKNLRGQERRLATGKAKATDLLKAYGSTTVAGLSTYGVSAAASLGRAANKKTDHELR
jgi:hypothetical protein